MSVSSIEFVLLLFLSAAVFWRLPGRRTQLAFMALGNTLVLYLMIPNVGSWIALTAFLLSGYFSAQLLQRRPSAAWFSAYLFALVAAFLILKKYEFLQWMLPASMLDHSLAIVGLSYMLFRQIHFVVDCMQGQLDKVSLVGYLNYQLNLFSLLSGPIMRYQNFQEYWRDPKPLTVDLHDLLKTILRIGIGLTKLSLCAVFFLWLYDKASSSLGQIRDGYLGNDLRSRMFYFVIMFYSFPAYVYFNFSGYCDIVIAGGKLFGLNIPENFDAPYLARNMIDYWNRWHRTLSHWIRDYIFMPLYKNAVQQRPTWAEPLAILFFFVALFLAGVWHGATLNWVIFGLLNGVGVSAAKLWEYLIIKRSGRSGLKNYLKRSWIRVLAIAVNLNFACLTMLFFPVDVGRTIGAVQIALFGR